MLRSVNSDTITWIDIQDPAKKDVAFLRQNFHFHPLILDELIPASYRPKIEHHEDYLFLALHYPVFNKSTRVTERKELDIIVTKTHIVTNHFGAAIPVKPLFDKINLYAEKKREYLSQTTGHLLYYIISSVLAASVEKAERLDGDMEKIEQEIFKGRERAMVSEISRIKRDVIDTRRILAPQGKIFKLLATESKKYWGDDLGPYFEDILGAYNGAWNSLQEHRETLAALGATNESLLAMKTNDIIKALTIITALSLPVSLTTAVWGMQTAPTLFAGAPYDFWIIMGGTAALELLTYYILKKKHWI